MRALSQILLLVSHNFAQTIQFYPEIFSRQLSDFVYFNFTYDMNQIFPTDAVVAFNFGDGSANANDVYNHVPLDDLFNGDTVYSTSHKYATSGDFVASVTISNEVSEKTFTVKVSAECCIQIIPK